MNEILAEARGERRFPGDGELNLVGLLRALPRDIPISIEVPTVTLARSVGAVERARRALAGTLRVLAQLAG
jgi:sugar phosphate isomerase/epimerase